MESGPVCIVRRLRPSSPLPYVVLVVLLVLQIVSPADAWSWTLTGLLVLVLLSYYWARLLRDSVTATREVQGTWVVAGDELRERFIVTNAGWLPAIWVRVRDGSHVPGYAADRVESVDSHSRRTWMFTGVCPRRGVFRLGPWDLEMSDPFGFFTVTQHYPVLTTITVHPRASHLPALDLPRGAASGRARSSLLSAAETITVAELREYHPGDSLRRVHWPASAHHGRLLVREFDREPTGDVWLVVDLDAGVQAGSEAEATAEYAVVLAVSLASQLLQGGERRGVGLLVSGQAPAWLPPGRGPAQLWQISRALAEAEPEPPAMDHPEHGVIGPSVIGWRRRLAALWRPGYPARVRLWLGAPQTASPPTSGATLRRWWPSTWLHPPGTAAAPAGGAQGSPASSRRSLEAILADLGPALGSGRTLVVITPSQDPDWVAALLPLIARGNAPVVLLLDATTFDPPRGSPDALAGLRTLLATQRIPVYPLAQGFPFAPVERIRRRRHILQTLPGTGRVIERDTDEEV